jgi:hypothetical protein
MHVIQSFDNIVNKQSFTHKQLTRVASDMSPLLTHNVEQISAGKARLDAWHTTKKSLNKSKGWYSTLSWERYEREELHASRHLWKERPSARGQSASSAR